MLTVSNNFIAATFLQAAETLERLAGMFETGHVDTNDIDNMMLDEMAEVMSELNAALHAMGGLREKLRVSEQAKKARKKRSKKA